MNNPVIETTTPLTNFIPLPADPRSLTDEQLDAIFGREAIDRMVRTIADVTKRNGIQEDSDAALDKG